VPNSTNKLPLELARNPTEALGLLPPKNMQLPVSAMTTWSTPILKLSMKIKRRAEDLEIHSIVAGGPILHRRRNRTNLIMVI
jgi:hypothetical protein